MDGTPQPRAARSARKKIENGVAWNGECESPRNHGVDADHASAGVGKRSAGITGSEPHSGLNPGLKAEAAHRADCVNHAGGERTNKTHWVADGDGKLAGPKLRRISGARGRQRVGMNSEGCEVAPRIPRAHPGLQLSPLPPLYASVRTAGHMCVRHDRAIARPNHAGAAATASGVNQNRRPAKLLRDLAKSFDGHVNPLLARDLPR